MTVATFLAESEIERIKSLTFKELTAEIADASTVVKRLDRLGTACTFASAAECPGFPYTLTIRYFPQFPTVYSHHAEVEVTWIDKTGPHGLLYTAVLTDLTF
jgi:hypothetical protein